MLVAFAVYGMGRMLVKLIIAGEGLGRASVGQRFGT
jgi:hypothetical protein